MSADPRILVRPAPPRPGELPAQSSPDLCGWCFGAGKYLEPLDFGLENALYLLVVCSACHGSGRKT